MSHSCGRYPVCFGHTGTAADGRIVHQARARSSEFFHPPIGDRHRPPTKPPGGESSGGCLCHDHGRIGLTSTGLRSCRGYCHRDCGCPLSLCAHLLRRCRYNNHRHCLLRRQHHHLRWTRRAREHQRTCRKCNPDHLPFLCNTQH